MAGYDWSAGMSNNAVAAYDRGLVTASQVRGIPAALVKRFCRYAERHHTSSRFNLVEFYEMSEVLQTFGLGGDPAHANPAAVEALAQWRANRESKVVHENCRVQWLEWHGSISRPYAVERVAEGCRVTVKGQTARVELPDGKAMTKRLSTRGFKFTPAATK